jgi:hypothetical protein
MPHNWRWSSARSVFVAPRFLIHIVSPTRCQLKSENEGWSKEFLSAKGALDFLEAVAGAQVTVAGSHGLKTLLHTEEANPHQTNLLHVE